MKWISAFKLIIFHLKTLPWDGQMTYDRRYETHHDNNLYIKIMFASELLNRRGLKRSIKPGAELSSCLEDIINT